MRWSVNHETSVPRSENAPLDFDALTACVSYDDARIVPWRFSGKQNKNMWAMGCASDLSLGDCDRRTVAARIAEIGKTDADIASRVLDDRAAGLQPAARFDSGSGMFPTASVK